VSWRLACTAGRRKSSRRCKRSSRWTQWKPWVVTRRWRTKPRETGDTN